MKFVMNKKNKIQLIINNKIRLKKVRCKKSYKDHRHLLEKQKVLSYLRNELENSTTHGLPHIVDRNNKSSEKLFWTASFLTCCILAVLLLNIQYTRFIAAPTVMSVEMNYYDWNISYPAITLCPLYKPDILKFQKSINNTNYQTGLKIDSYMWTITEAALDTLQYLELDVPEEIASLIQPEDYTTVASTMFRKFGNSSLATNTNWSIGVEAAMTEMGMCHVINSNVAKYDIPQKWNETATYVKNNVELSVFEVDFYTELIDYAPVYKVFIHSPDEITTSTTSTFPFDVEGSITFGLSVWSSRISEELRSKSIRLRKCRFLDEPTSERYPIYSYSHCVLECRIKMIIRLCGCIPHFYKRLKHERICHISELKCVLYYKREIITLRASRETLKKFNYAKDLPRISKDCGCLSTCELDLYYKDNEDYVPNTEQNKLTIKITSFPKVRVVRDIIFDFYDIILRSGGVVNLCIGSSIISIMELIVLFIKIAIYLSIAAIQIVI